MALIIIPFNIASIYSGKVKTPKAMLVIKLILTSVMLAVFAYNLYATKFLPVFTSGFEIMAVHAICPILAFICIAFFETGKKFGWGWIFFGLLSAVYYAVFNIKDFSAKVVKLLSINVYLSTSLEFYVTLAIFAVGGVLIAFVLWLINSLLSKDKKVDETIKVVEENTDVVEETATEPEEQPNEVIE